jgi:uncharacterized damage-inducible protein DinB
MHQPMEQPSQALFAGSWLAVNDDMGAKGTILQALNHSQDARHIWMRVGHPPKRGDPCAEL